MTLLLFVGEALAAAPHETTAQDWLTPLGVLIAGLAVAYVYLSTAQANDPDAAVDIEARRIDLGATRDEVVEALRQLEVEKGKMDPGQYEVERQLLLKRGSQALRELEGDAEEASTTSDAPEAEPTPAPASSETSDRAAAEGGPVAVWNALAPEWRGAIAALSVVAVIGGFIWMLQSDTRERREGDPITGSDIVTNDNARPEGLDRADPQTVAQIEAFEAQLKENPDDVGTLNMLTQLYLSASAAEQAFNHNQRAREIDPKNKDARAYLGVLRMMMGMPDNALIAFDEIIAEDASHLLSRFYKGLVLMELRRFDEAVVAFEGAIEVDPNNPNLARALADAKALASGKTPSPPSAPPQPAAAGGNTLVSGTVELAPGRDASGVLFVSLRTLTGGPPVAAKRFSNPSFPLDFEVTKADMLPMMRGRPIPEQLLLKVHVDRDGNASTLEDGPAAVLPTLKPGTTGVSLTLE